MNDKIIVLTAKGRETLQLKFSSKRHRNNLRFCLLEQVDFIKNDADIQEYDFVKLRWFAEVPQIIFDFRHSTKGNKSIYYDAIIYRLRE